MALRVCIQDALDEHGVLAHGAAEEVGGRAVVDGDVVFEDSLLEVQPGLGLGERDPRRFISGTSTTLTIYFHN